MTDIKTLYQQAYKFEKLAFDPYNAKLRYLIVNVPPMPNALSFRDIAEIVIDDLNALDPQNQDSAIVSAIHGLMSTLNNVEIPSGQELMSRVKAAYDQINLKAPADKKKMVNAKYLTNLANVLLYKYYQEGQAAQQTPGQETDGQALPPTTQMNENVLQFLTRTYKKLRAGQALDQNDKAGWANFKSTLMNRLNALNAIKTRTQRQNEERYVIQFVASKLG